MLRANIKTELVTAAMKIADSITSPRGETRNENTRIFRGRKFLPEFERLRHGRRASRCSRFRFGNHYASTHRAATNLPGVILHHSWIMHD